jgi:hypothetical protein
LLYKSDKPGSLKLQVGDSQLKINLVGDTLSIKSMLDHLFKDETTKRESGALLKEFGSFYQPSDPSLVTVLEQQDIQSEVAKRLRNLLYSLKGPFEEQAKEILLSVPQGNRIPAGRAASCKGSTFYRREIRIFNLQRTNSISAYVSGSFPCPEVEIDDQKEIGKLIQISYLDMKKLIGDSTLIAKEPGFAEILIDAQ